MPLRTVLSGVDETLQEMYLAAEHRYKEGSLLLSIGELDAAIYLLGYSAEMLLKLAYCRLDSTIGLTDLVMGRLVVAEARWRAIYQRSSLTRRDQKFDMHDLIALLVSIEDGRLQFSKPPLTVSQIRSLNDCVFTVYENWWVAMRYRSRYATLREATQVLEAVEWLRSNHQQLWK